jgi:hypothetical protein
VLVVEPFAQADGSPIAAKYASEIPRPHVAERRHAFRQMLPKRNVFDSRHDGFALHRE